MNNTDKILDALNRMKQKMAEAERIAKEEETNARLEESAREWIKYNEGKDIDIYTISSPYIYTTTTTSWTYTNPFKDSKWHDLASCTLTNGWSGNPDIRGSDWSGK